MKILILCGGPSVERNISLNSARSVYDALSSNKNYKKIGDLNLKVIFIDKNYEKYLINEESLYSNTTSDFDFKLKKENIPLNDDEFKINLKDVDLVFPIMHGIYAEDGQIQTLLEQHNISYVGSPPDACFNLYNKYAADKMLKKIDFFTVKKLFINSKMSPNEIKFAIFEFFEKNNLKEVIIKPTEGGSSFGVKHIKSFEEALLCTDEMKFKGYSDLVIEERCFGKEFTVIILQNPITFEPVPLIPTEIEIKDDENIIFDTRRKYLATNETHYHFPPRFSQKIIDEIRKQASYIFKIFGAKDFLRIDGWLLDDGNIYFSDFNPISGMEQNSFIFQQGSKIGLTHKEIIRHIIKCSLSRNDKVLIEQNDNLDLKRKRVNVLFGGITSERQVSLLSGSNVWLKLLKTDNLNPVPFLLYSKDSKFYVLELSYDMVLYHTVEEILFQFKQSNISEEIISIINNIRGELGLKKDYKYHKKNVFTFEEFLDFSKEENAYVFCALHGGFGENGEIQKLLEEKRLKFNGSGSIASRICMDKFETGKIVNSLNFGNFRTAKKILFNINEKIPTWNEITEIFGSEVIIKPNSDGCSTGVAVISSESEFNYYIKLITSDEEFVPAKKFKFQKKNIILSRSSKDYLIEEFIKTDKIEIKNKDLVLPKSPLNVVELTIGVLENSGFYHALNPSITIAEAGSILSVEEKFQGGTGINITPPPEEIINKNLIQTMKFGVEKLCSKIGIKDYCRIDLFADNKKNEIIVIEINTLPALTPSTVLFQQASKEFISLNPIELLEGIIKF